MSNNIFSLPRVGQFMGVWADQTRNFGAIQCRVIGYSALNVFGMIGPERNGIAILNDSEKSVITTDIGRQLSGYDGPSELQKQEFARLVACDESEFKDACFSGNSRIA